jgi:deazaflavin-dependent oxidoreductase (nitroreductase family)
MARLKPGLIRAIGGFHAWLWKLTGGSVGAGFGRAPCMLLTTKGRKTGRPRTTPVLYLEDTGGFVAVASFGGNDAHPAWYLNLQSCPEAEVVVKGERRKVVARTLSREEKAIVWPRVVKMYPNFNAYQQRTKREIPLVKLTTAA